MPPLPLPSSLTRLLEAGIWPAADGPSMATLQLPPFIPEERVRRFAPDESLICLQRPPFRTIEQRQAGGGSGDFWEKHCSLDQIVPGKALIIGGFEIGSDSPIILD